MSTFAHAADADGDGIDDASDNCPAISNPDQRDREGDGRGDACDVCPDVYDPSQRDRDGDHLGDACELWSDIVWIINGVDEPGYSNCAFSCGNTSSCRDRCGAAYRRAFLYTMDFTGAHRTEIPAGNRHVTLWDADLSPDGRRLAYYKADDPFYPGVTTPSLACVLDGHGTQCFDIPFQFSKRFSSDLTWGADSRTLYFALPDVMNFSRLRTDDSAPHREAMPSKSTVPVCRFTASPDGARMALVRRSNCNSSFGPLGFYDLATHGETFSYGPDSYFAPEYGPVGDILAWSRPINILCGFQQPCWTIWEGNSEKADPIDRASDSPGYRYIFPRFSPDGGEMFQLRWLENPYAWMEIRVVDRTSGAASMVASLGVNLTGVTYNGITDYDVSNAFFGDSDGDGIPYGRDNCPDVPNTAQDDYDGDLVGDVCDCARANDDSFDLPGEVTNLRYSFWSNTWNWTPSTIASGSGTRYQILRGPLEDLPVTGRSSDVCLAAAFEGVSMENTADAPAPGHGWWYLVGGWNACGNGTLGHRSTGPQRTSQACSEQFPIPVHDTNSPPRSE